MKAVRVPKFSSTTDTTELHFGIYFSLVYQPSRRGLIIAPLRNEAEEIVNFFGAQVDVSSLFQKHNDLSAILSKDFALPETPPATAEGGRKSFFRRLSEKTKTSLRPNHSSTLLSGGLEQEVVHENISTIGEQMSVFRSAYAKV